MVKALFTGTETYQEIFPEVFESNGHSVVSRATNVAMLSIESPKEVNCMDIPIWIFFVENFLNHFKHKMIWVGE